MALNLALVASLAACVPDRDVATTGSINASLDRGKLDDPALKEGLERLAERQRRTEAAALSPKPETVPETAREAGPSPKPQQVARAEEPTPVPVPAAPPPVPGPEVTADADTPMDCLPGGLRRILDETARRFGPVEVVSTTHLHTGNHNAGRAKIHADCKAADIRTQAPAADVIAFVRTMPGLGGVGTYRNGIIHLDDASAHPPDAYAKRPGAPDAEASE